MTISPRLFCWANQFASIRERIVVVWLWPELVWHWKPCEKSFTGEVKCSWSSFSICSARYIKHLMTDPREKVVLFPWDPGWLYGFTISHLTDFSACNSCIIAKFFFEISMYFFNHCCCWCGCCSCLSAPTLRYMKLIMCQTKVQAVVALVGLYSS